LNLISASNHLMRKILLAAPCFLLATICSAASAPATVEQWGVLELAFAGPSGGNPFVDVTLSAKFAQGERTLTAHGFYDGGGTYKIRFMPETVGEWRYTTASNLPELDGKSGTFTATPPAKDNHGPVRVARAFHFAYADGTPFRQIGTTCYAWVHQTEELQEQTLKTLTGAPFNKIRFCVFPKYYDWNHNDPLLYPYEGAPNKWDTARFNPAFFHHFEKRIEQLRELGIEADIILFHPYDRGHWGFDRMDAASNDRYLHYVVARFAAYRNVWWSLANEFDFITNKRTEDWDRFFQIVQTDDPFQHLRSIHNGSRMYDNNKPWVTHSSIQNGSAVVDFGRAQIYRDVWGKPVVFDEVKYEGNIPQRFGSLTAEEMTMRFWEGTVAGTYVGHGETYLDPNDVLWWAKGGVLHGQSPARLAFLRKIMEDGPPALEPIDKWQDNPFAGVRGKYYLGYLGRQAPTSWKFELYKGGLTEGMKFRVEVIDTWNMTITPVDDVFVVKKKEFKGDAAANYAFDEKDGKSVPLPGKPYIALRIRLQE
jgi:hypothetical protein